MKFFDLRKLSATITKVNKPPVVAPDTLGKKPSAKKVKKQPDQTRKFFKQSK